MTSARRARGVHLVIAVSSVLAPVAFVAALVVAWEVTFRATDVQPFVMPRPSAIWDSFIANRATYFRYGLNTLSEAGRGLVYGSLVGILVAALVFRRRVARSITRSTCAGLIALPLVAIVPLVNVFFGVGSGGRVLIVALGAAPMLTIFTLEGLLSADEGLEDCFKVCAASRFETVVKLYVPSAVPFIMSGLRVAVPGAFAVAVVAEFFGGRVNTLGAYISAAATNSDVAGLWGAAFTAFLFAATIFVLLVAAERLVLRGRGTGDR